MDIEFWDTHVPVDAPQVADVRQVAESLERLACQALQATTKPVMGLTST